MIMKLSYINGLGTDSVTMRIWFKGMVLNYRTYVGDSFSATRYGPGLIKPV
jgi:hypothetical protein